MTTSGSSPYMNGAFGFYSIMTGYKKKDITLVTFNPPVDEVKRHGDHQL
ncbi:MAG: hypothetical protein MZV63_35165 [Marinilabiliales bacterium]|nr:hypothetical protein [Marinilabiliales bacterium]